MSREGRPAETGSTPEIYKSDLSNIICELSIWGLHFLGMLT